MESSEYATAPIPDEKTIGWFRIMLVAAIVSFSLPIFLTGVEIAAGSSPTQTLKILIVGTIVLTLVGCLTASIGASTRLSSYMLNRIAFGSSGAALVNLAFAFSLLGWFGVNIDLFSGAVQRLAVELFGLALPAWPIELFAGAVMTVTTVIGFKAINVLSALLVPVFMVVTALLILGSLQMQSMEELLQMSSATDLDFGDGVSAVVGAMVVGAVILPDITRFVRHWHGAIWVVLISYLVVQLLVMSAGGLAATALKDNDLLAILITLGLGWAAFTIVILGSWVLNSLNLYSAMLSVESSTTGVPNKLLVSLLGCLGTVAAFFDILDHFLSFLFYLSIIFIPVTGVIAVDYLVLRRSAYHLERASMQQALRPYAVMSWGIGACTSLIGTWGWVSLSGIAAVDAIVVAAIAYYFLMRMDVEINRRKQRGPKPKYTK